MHRHHSQRCSTKPTGTALLTAWLGLGMFATTRATSAGTPAPAITIGSVIKPQVQESQGASASAAVVGHVWEPVEVTLISTTTYENPYTDCEVWAELTGPGGFGTKRV